MRALGPSPDRLLRTPAVVALGLLLQVGPACEPSQAGGEPDAATAIDAGSWTDAGPGRDAGIDAGPLPDAGPGPDAGPPDAGAADANRCGVEPTGSVSLPADDAVHAERMEWWYWTGHLETQAGRWFGFELVFFRTLLLGQSGRMVHVALTDIESGEFHYSTQEDLSDYPVVPDGFAFDMNGQTAAGGGGQDVLHGEVDGILFDLSLSAVKPVVLQHETGYTAYPFGGYTYYYSRERMDVAGTIAFGGAALAVEGSGWFDHQWGDMLHALDLGWDWFAMQLDDHREIMLFVVRDASANLLVGGSTTDARCVASAIAPQAFSVTPLGSWTSPHTFCTYPSGWTVTVGTESFTVTPVLGDQEVSTALPIYWEGAATVTGASTGRAYVELTGYCP